MLQRIGHPEHRPPDHAVDDLQVRLGSASRASAATFKALTRPARAASATAEPLMTADREAKVPTAY